MPYGINVTPFYELDGQLRDLPERLPHDPRPLERVLFAYISAFQCLLDLVMALMRLCVERQEQRLYVTNFFPVYDEAANRALQLLETEVQEGLEEQSTNLVELIYAIRDSQVGPELVALAQALAESEKVSEPEDHLDTTTTVTNSLKEQIEKYTKKKRIKSVLRAINEVISIVRGVV